jgi:hypothetical protein
MKWRETMTHKTASNPILSIGVAGSFMYWCFSPFHLLVFFSYFIYRCCWQFYVLVFLEKHRHIKLPATPIDKIGEKHQQMKWRETPTHKTASNTDR